ncbi:hypothetical protein GW866_07605 [bacterium]|nr:hypothetical protein [bacterium]OIO84270.1 MAG: hypothetical protein AUK02_07295 [Anaerolineae bacterium CG2_30_58_95]PJH75564.1 MAG: hypothetical protein CO064_05980 [Anaerolineae bacterium CG_4_9_14_0_8_um_filter_58_9]
MLTVKAKIHSQTDYEPILPLAIPDLKEVRAFANHLHLLGKTWQGEIFGWSAEYTPESDQKPFDTKMTFTPAEFMIGESGIWFFSLMWEVGKDNEPVEFLDDRGLVK